MAMKVSVNTLILGKGSILLILDNCIDTAEKGLSTFTVNVQILIIRGNVGNNKNFRIASLTVEIAAREEEWITVKVIEHITVFQATSELLKNKYVLAIIGIEGMLIVSDTVTIGISVFIHNGAGFTGSRMTENVSNMEVTPK